MDERWRVLVVDDDPDVLDLISLKLASQYNILCVDQATEVSQAVDLFEPDLIILDIMLPKISGYQIMEYLRRNPRTAKIPVCFLSAKASARDLKYGYSLGASLYLTKPFQPERLVKNINLMFDRTPPDRRDKQFSIDEVNERLKVAGAYQVAAGEAETVARETERRDRATATDTASPPEEDDENDPTHRRWVE